MTNEKMKEESLIPDWVWVLLVAVPTILLLRIFLWWLLCPSYERMEAVEIDAFGRSRRPEPEKPDDLTRIKGIGPKLSQALREAGIWSYGQLALIEKPTLERVLEEANARISNAETWKKQAELAAQENWQELEAYQQEI